MPESFQQSAIQTFEQEAAALSSIKNLIGASFDAAVHCINNCAGRIIITGVGKSAIVAQKIVATFNSTGTPAVFLHAADAIHGDLGMIKKDDVVMLLSKSGESAEIKTLVPLIKAFGNTIIAVAGNINSFLAKNATIVLNTTISEEACPNNLAPTTSSTVQMVMGDALAIALMQLNGFDGSSFAKYHPGGNLGKRLYLKIDDLYKMNEKPFVDKHSSLKNIILTITKGRLGATAVIDAENKVEGIITDGDIRRLLEKTDDIKNISAADFFNINPKTIISNMLAVEALEQMNLYNINQLIVTDDKKEYLGMIHLHDLTREGII